MNALHGHTFSRSGSEFRQLLDWLRVSFCEANTSIALKKPICWDIWVNHQKSPIPILSIHVFFRNSCKWEDIGWNLLGKRFQHVATGKFTACRLHPILDAKRPVLPGFSLKKHPNSWSGDITSYQLVVNRHPSEKKSTVKHRVSKHSPKLPGWKLQTNWNCWSDRPVVCPIFTTSYHRVNLTCLHRKLCDRCVGGWEKNTSKTLFGWGLCLTPQSTDDPFLFRSCASGHKKSQSILFKEPCLKRKQSAKTIPKPTTLRILGSLQIATF